MSDDFTIRNFTEDDFIQVSELWNQTGLNNPQRADNLDTIMKTLQTGGAFFVMEHTTNQQIVGTSWITNDGRRLYLHHFGILPEYQGQHLATDLLNASLVFAKSTGLQIKLEVHKENKKAVQLYQKAGFTYLGDYHVYIIRNYQ